jgi:hypothetical protein
VNSTIPSLLELKKSEESKKANADFFKLIEELKADNSQLKIENIS